MTARPRILLCCTSAKNPFLEAWVETLRASGARVAVVVDVRSTRETEVPASIASLSILLPSERPKAWKQQVRDLLGGDPQVLFVWWGMHALAEPLVVHEWPDAARVLCVDTFPNASRLRAAMRDLWNANRLLGRAAGLVHASRRMRVAVDRATLGRSARLHSAIVYSPFPSAAHRGTVREAGAGSLRLCFTGRSDHLYSTDAGMGKDALGPSLERFIERGAEVHVLDPGPATSQRLLDRGFRFYEEVDRSAILTGGFAETIDAFDGHLVGYALPNRTSRARVQNSLSTRFATAVCSAAPIVAPLEAAFVDEVFARAPIGFRADDPDEILGRLRDEQAAMRRAWAAHHDSWAGEAFGDELSSLWAKVITTGR